MINFPAQIQLMNGKEVELTEGEFEEFISDIMMPNPQWRHSGLLDQDEFSRYLKGEGTVQDLRKVIRYILVYQENLSLIAYLFAKSENQNNATESKGYNVPTLKRLRAMHGLSTTDSVNLLKKIAGKMVNLCMKVGSSPL